MILQVCAYRVLLYIRYLSSGRDDWKAEKTRFFISKDYMKHPRSGYRSYADHGSDTDHQWDQSDENERFRSGANCHGFLGKPGA